MDSGDLLAIGLLVHNLVVVEYKLNKENATIPHPPMVVQIVMELQPNGVSAINNPVLAKVRMFISN